MNGEGERKIKGKMKQNRSQGWTWKLTQKKRKKKKKRTKERKLIWQADVRRKSYFTHQRVFCVSVGWLCPRVSQLWVGLPASLNIFISQIICPSVFLSLILFLVTGLDLFSPGLSQGRTQVTKIFLDAGLSGQGFPARQQGPRAPPAGTGAGLCTTAGGNAGRDRIAAVSEIKPRFFFFASTVQSTVRAPR